MTATSQAMDSFRLSQAVHKKQLRAERGALGLCMLEKFFYDNLACM